MRTTEPAHVDPADSSVPEVALASLPPGRCQVIWRVVSVDIHETEGRYAFDMLPQARCAWQ